MTEMKLAMVDTAGTDATLTAREPMRETDVIGAPTSKCGVATWGRVRNRVFGVVGWRIWNSLEVLKFFSRRVMAESLSRRKSHADRKQCCVE